MINEHYQKSVLEFFILPKTQKMLLFSQSWSTDTDTFVKPIFCDLGGRKTLTFDENLESNFSYETNTFSFIMRM